MSQRMLHGKTSSHCMRRVEAWVSTPLKVSGPVAAARVLRAGMLRGKPAYGVVRVCLVESPLTFCVRLDLYEKVCTDVYG